MSSKEEMGAVHMDLKVSSLVGGVDRNGIIIMRVGPKLKGQCVVLY